MQDSLCKAKRFSLSKIAAVIAMGLTASHAFASGPAVTHAQANAMQSWNGLQRFGLTRPGVSATVPVQASGVAASQGANVATGQKAPQQGTRSGGGGL